LFSCLNTARAAWLLSFFQKITPTFLSNSTFQSSAGSSFVYILMNLCSCRALAAEIRSMSGLAEPPSDSISMRIFVRMVYDSSVARWSPLNSNTPPATLKLPIEAEAPAAYLILRVTT